MIGLFLWKDPGGPGVLIRERIVFHTRFLCAEVSRGERTPVVLLRLRERAAGRRLERLGAARTVLPEGLSPPPGLLPFPTAALRRALAAEWVRGALGDRPGATVAVRALRLDGDVVRTVRALALRHRYVMLDVPDGGELCRALRREYGVSLLLAPSPEQLAEAEALVCFDPKEGEETESQNPVVLRLWDENQPLPPLLLPPEVEEAVPPSVDRGQFLSALLESGAVRPERLAVGGRRE